MDPAANRYRPGEGSTQRFLDDIRTLSASGIERVAWGWDRHETNAIGAFHAAEKAAIHALEQSEPGAKWDLLRNQVLGLTEGRNSLVSWKAEHGELGHKAERAALGAALALLVADHIEHREVVTLVRPMAEALPWLLPEAPPAPRL